MPLWYNERFGENRMNKFNSVQLFNKISKEINRRSKNELDSSGYEETLNALFVAVDQLAGSDLWLHVPALMLICENLQIDLEEV